MKATKSYLLKLTLLVCMLFGLMTVSVSAAKLYTTPDGLYTFTLSSGKAIINSYNGLASRVSIPDKVQVKAGGKQYTVAHIGNGKKSILGSSDEVKQVILPAHVTKIAANAFLNARALTSVTVGSKVRTIADNAFQGCSKLTVVDLTGAKALTTIGDEVFVDCTSLTSFVSGPAVETIGDGAFLGCTSLESVTFSAVLTSIGDEAFRKCTSLALLSTLETVPSYNQAKRHLPFVIGTTLIYFPTSLETIGTGAFYGSGLTGVLFIPYKVQDIQESTFQSCKRLTGLYLTTGIETIGDSAFKGCSAMKDIFLPTSLNEIADNAFAGDTINNDRTALYLFKKSEIDRFLNGARQYDADIFNYLDSNKHTFQKLVDTEGYTMSDTLYASKTTFWAGQTVDLKILFNKPLTTELSDTITWKTNRPGSLLFVRKNQDSAVITSTASGTGYMVKAIVDENHDASINLTVKPAPKSVVIRKSGADAAAKYKCNLKKKNTVQLVADTFPENGADVTWTSSDKSIATVSADGLVTNPNNVAGTVKITAESYNHKKTTCEIEFFYSYENCNKKYLVDSKNDIEIAAGSRKRITKSNTPTGMVFTSSNPAIATIDNNGIVTTYKAGTVKITGKYTGKKSTSTVELVETYVYVVPKAQTIKLVQQSNGVKVKWKKDDTCQGYVVRYGTSEKSYNTVKATLPPTKTTYLLKVLPKGKKAVIQVASYITHKGKKHYGKFAIASIVPK